MWRRWRWAGVRLTQQRCFSTSISNESAARIAVVGTGRMGQLRIKAVKANQRTRLPYVVTENESEVEGYIVTSDP